MLHYLRFENEGKYSIACVARDCSGDLIEATTYCRIGNLAPELVEAIVVKEALQWIKRKEWYRSTVETDCLIVVQAFVVTLAWSLILVVLLMNVKGY